MDCNNGRLCILRRLNLKHLYIKRMVKVKNKVSVTTKAGIFKYL